MPLSPEITKKIIRQIGKKITVKATNKFACIDIMPSIVEELVNSIVEDFEGNKEVETLLREYITVDMPDVVLKLLVEEIAERISTDIAIDFIQIIAPWPATSIKH